MDAPDLRHEQLVQEKRVRRTPTPRNRSVLPQARVKQTRDTRPIDSTAAPKAEICGVPSPRVVLARRVLPISSGLSRRVDDVFGMQVERCRPNRGNDMKTPTSRHAAKAVARVETPADIEHIERRAAEERASEGWEGPVTASERRLKVLSPPSSHQTLERYRLLSELGSGGMARVYLARDTTRTGVNGIVAIKCLHAHLVDDPEFSKMFLDEARISSRMRHPNVASIFDYEAGPGGYYIVEEYLSGRSLAEVRRVSGCKPRTRLLAARVARILTDACEGVHAANEARDAEGRPLGLVHRDIALDNLFLTYEGVTKLIDFGVARSSIQTHRTRAGALMGKLAYMPPEALQGYRCDRRADVWGLGVVAWEMLTGKRLFRRASQSATLQAVLQSEILPPSRLDPDIPSEFDAPILRALERDRNARFSSARELGCELFEAGRKSGCFAHLPRISQWMDELFPGCREENERRVFQEATPHFESPTTWPPAFGEKVPRSSSETEQTLDDRPLGALIAAVEETHAAQRETPQSHSWPVVALVVVASLGIGSASAVLWASKQADSPPRAAVKAPGQQSVESHASPPGDVITSTAIAEPDFEEPSTLPAPSQSGAETQAETAAESESADTSRESHQRSVPSDPEGRSSPSDLGPLDDPFVDSF